MNFVSICAQTTEAPRTVYTSESQTVTRCNLLIPPVGNKAPTAIEYNVYGQQQDIFRSSVTEANQLIYIHGAKLRHDLDARVHSLHGGNVAVVTEDFPIFNTVILGGRCIKDISESDSRQYKVTEQGLMIANQTLSVNTGKQQADLFNFYAINKQEDRLRNAELLLRFTRKGIGITIQGRLTTDAWKDTNGQPKTNTKIQLVSMTLGPKADNPAPASTPAPIQTQQNPVSVPAGGPVPSLWGGKTASTGGLPELPTNFGSPVVSADDAEAPF